MLGGGSGGLDVSAGASTASSSGGGGLWQFFFSPSDSSHLDSLNQPLNDWNVSKVTDMREMFKGAESFNQPLNVLSKKKLQTSRHCCATARVSRAGFARGIRMAHVQVALGG